MRASHLSTALLLITASTATAQSSEKSKLKELLDENKVLAGKIGQAETAEKQIGKAELSISGKQAALNRAKEQLRRSELGLEREAEGIVKKADATGCPWGTVQDSAYAKSCNDQLEKLNALYAQVKTKAITVVEYKQKLDGEQRSLSTATLELTKKRKANNNELQLLYDARSDWQERYNAFVFNSEAYRRLRDVQSPGSVGCVRIADAGTPAALERAAQCLQRLWDGAR